MRKKFDEEKVSDPKIYARIHRALLNPLRRGLSVFV